MKAVLVSRLEIQRLEQQQSDFESQLETVEGRQRTSEVSLAQLGGLVKGISELQAVPEAKPLEGPSSAALEICYIGISYVLYDDIQVDVYIVYIYYMVFCGLALRRQGDNSDR